MYQFINYLSYLYTFIIRVVLYTVHVLYVLFVYAYYTCCSIYSECIMSYLYRLIICVALCMY